MFVPQATNAGFAVLLGFVALGEAVQGVSAGQPATGAATQPAATQPAVTKQVIVQGQLYDHVGAGVAQARVTATHKETGRVLGTAVTNEFGDFSIESAERPSGTVSVTFEKKGRKTHTVEIEPDPAGEAIWLDWEMQGDLDLSGLVIDDLSGKPVTGATVRVEAAYRQWSASTGQDGKFLVEGLPPGSLRVVVEAEKYARQVLPAKLAVGDGADKPATNPATQPAEEKPPKARTIRLKPERIIHLTIVDEADKSISGASVECYDEKNNDYRHLVTGEDGRLTVRGLSCDALELGIRLSHEAFVSATDFDRVLKLPADKTETSHRLVMKRAGIICGKVLRAETGKPLLGARVSVGEVLSDMLPRAWSAFGGGYRVMGVTPGEVVVTVHLAGHAPQLKKLTVQAGAETSLDFEMKPTGSIVGTVVGEDGQPLPGVYIAATKWRGYATLGLQALTDDQGRFEILDLPADPFEVSVYIRGYKPLLEQTIDPSAAGPTFTLQVDARSQPGQTAPALTVGQQAPDFAFRTLAGESIRLADLKGKVVLLGFWATWCGPCVVEAPALVEAYRAFGKRSDFVMISVSLDQDEKTLRAFIEAQKMEWHHVFGKDGGAERAADAYHVVAIPSIFIIGPDGKIAAADLSGPRIQRELGLILRDK